MKYFKVYGLHRTGTNYISSLIEKNFKNVHVFVNIGGWKHGDIDLYQDEIISIHDGITEEKYDINHIKNLFEKQQVNFFVCVKNPYTWLDSYLRFKKLKKNKTNISNGVKLWNERYKNYRENIDNGNAYLVKYEEVISNYAKFLSKFEKRFHLKKNGKKFVNIKNKLDANNDITAGNVRKEIFTRKNFYLDPDYKRIFNGLEIIFIDYVIDRDLVKYYGYEILSERDLPYCNRLKNWYYESYREKGIWVEKGKIDKRYAILPMRFVNNVSKLSQTKKYNFIFIGAYRDMLGILTHREWIIPFIKKHFDHNSYLQFTDKYTRNSNYKPLGVFDHTMDKKGFDLKEVGFKDSDYYDQEFYSKMCQSKFCLCPGGDMPYSMRFYEALLCKTIPIVSKISETYRTEDESKIPYDFYFDDRERYTYIKKWVENNYSLFIEYHTLG